MEYELFSALRKDTISIGFPADRPRIGTIGKNHIQSSLVLLRTALFLALNLILS